MKKFKLTIYFILLSLLIYPAFGKLETPKETILDNGLKVITLERHNLPIISVCMVYKAGSRNETSQIAGCSYLLERLLSVSTKNLPPGAIDYILTQSGAIYNAYTTKDLTIFYETLPAKYLDLVLRIEAERMTGLDIKPDILKKEKETILKEIEQTDKNILEKLSQKVDNCAFTVHSYKLPTIGYKDSMLNLTNKEIKDYHYTYYRPNNAILILVGDFKTKQVIKKVKFYFEKIPSPKAITPLITEPKQTAERLVEIKNSDKENFLEIAFHAPSAFSPETPNLMLLNYLLAKGEKSRLNKTLVVNNLAYYVSAVPNLSSDTIIFPKKDPYLLRLFIRLKENISAKEVSKIVFQEIEKIKKCPPEEEELERFKNQLLMALFLNQESNFKKANLLAYYEGVDSYKTIKWITYQINQITPQEISETAKKYLALENSITGYVIQSKDPTTSKQINSKDTLFVQKENEVKLYKKIRSLKKNIKKTKTSKKKAKIFPVRKKLDNKITLIVYPDNSNRVVTIKLLVKAGCLYEPIGKPGLANLVAHLVAKESRNQTSYQIYDTLDYLGADLSSDNTPQGVIFTIKALPENYLEVLKILSDLLQNPVFLEEKIHQQKSLLTEFALYQSNNPRNLAQRKLLNKLLNESHPLCSWHPDPTEFLKNITLEDVVNFYNQYYYPENVIICVVGGVSAPDEVAGKINQIFKDWKNLSSSEKIKAFESKELSPKIKVVTFQLPGYTEMFFGALTVPRDHPDFYVVNLANYILGGNPFKSRLKVRLKDKEKLVQSVYSWLWPLPDKSVWELGIVANTKDTELLKKIIQIELKNLKIKGVTHAELAEAKNYFLNSMPVLLDDPGNLAEVLINLEYYNLDLNYLKDFYKIYSGITRKQIKEAFQKYFNFRQEENEN